ncbi:MAG: hypothetical protein ACTS4W_00340 [Candidatus Hodgkinia cicadicola]
MFGETILSTKRSFNFRICIEPIVTFDAKRRTLLCKSDLAHPPNMIVVACLSSPFVNVSNLTLFSGNNGIS